MPLPLATVAVSLKLPGWAAVSELLLKVTFAVSSETVQVALVMVPVLLSAYFTWQVFKSTTALASMVLGTPLMSIIGFRLGRFTSSFSSEPSFLGISKLETPEISSMLPLPLAVIFLLELAERLLIVQSSKTKVTSELDSTESLLIFALISTGSVRVPSITTLLI